MNPETLIQINDLRARILEVQDLQARGQPVPHGLHPTPQELRDALTALRQDRMAKATKSKSRTRKEPAIDPNMDLNDLFSNLSQGTKKES